MISTEYSIVYTLQQQTAQLHWTEFSADDHAIFLHASDIHKL